MIGPITVIIMTKLPEPGRVKTRLEPDLSSAQAAAVHRQMLLHVVERMAELQSAQLVICYNPPDAGEAIQSLLPGIRARFLPQVAGDLGQRMAAAFASAREPSATIFLGVDSPDLPTDHLRQAIEMLRQADVVLGPSRDGGYWCLGLTPGVDAAALLANIDWSSGREARQTTDAAHRLGLTVALVDEWDDIDRIDDLHRLIQRLGRSTIGRDAELKRRLTDILEEDHYG